MRATGNTKTMLLPGLITRAAERLPGHSAVTMSGVGLTYEQLEDRSNQLANFLGEIGVLPGDRVGIHAHKSLEVIAALYGIMKAGAAYVPINPDAPAAYLREILLDCDISHLVSEPSKKQTVVELAGDSGLKFCVGFDSDDTDPITCFDWEDVWSAPKSTAAAPTLTDRDPAYILYTSGSTGHPKGIVHSHLSGLAFAEMTSSTYGFTSSDRLSSHAPLHFDLSTLDLFAGASAAATTVLVPETHVRLPASFSQLLEDENITVTYAVPFAFVQLLRRGAISERDLSSLRWVVFAGEVFPTKHLGALMRLIPHARFSNIYGPTETNGVTYYHVPQLSPDVTDPIPIGRPFEGVDTLVVDNEGQSLPAGGTGELLIRSDTQMSGYWGRPDLTELSMFGWSENGAADRLFYRTGDIVRADSEGDFALIGRKDRQIKTRGHRVELDEIEIVLNNHESVEEAVAYTIPDGEGSHEIRAVVKLTEGADREDQSEVARTLKRYLVQILPRYAVPTMLEVVETVPRTSTGKVDRAVLIKRHIELSAGQQG